MMYFNIVENGIQYSVPTKEKAMIGEKVLFTDPDKGQYVIATKEGYTIAFYDNSYYNLFGVKLNFEKDIKPLFKPYLIRS